MKILILKFPYNVYSHIRILLQRHILALAVKEDNYVKVDKGEGGVIISRYSIFYNIKRDPVENEEKVCLDSLLTVKQ